jgi:DNA-binding NarL/FixJ family response regulator
LADSSTAPGDEAASQPPLESAIGVLVVADIRVYRDALAESLGHEGTIEPLGTAAGADDALARARALRPDVILVHIAMPDGVHAVRTLAQDVPEAKILALAVPEGEVIAYVEAGAAGCVTPEAPLEEVVSAVECITRGEALSSPRMTAILIGRVRALAAERPPKGLEELLTPREREIVALIDEGLSNKQIAERLCIEPATVKNHVHNTLQKLHVGRRGEAAAVVRHHAGADDA